MKRYSSYIPAQPHENTLADGILDGPVARFYVGTPSLNSCEIQLLLKKFNLDLLFPATRALQVRPPLDFLSNKVPVQGFWIKSVKKSKKLELIIIKSPGKKS